MIKLISIILCALPLAVGAVDSKALLEVPTEKASVGVVPYYVQNKQIYILLGQERVDASRHPAAGTYSDFGGRVLLDGSTFVDNAIRKLHEESMGQIVLSKNDILSKSQILYKQNSEGRKIYYLFYPLSKEEFLKTSNLNALIGKPEVANMPAAYRAKNQFYWFKLADVVAQKPQLQDIDGNMHIAQMRNFFIRDCIENPELPALIKKLN